MVRLTEDMIVARTRVSDMGHVKKLNCWGAELTDISVLRKLTNVEVLSLSVNSISTLEDVSYCKNLQELYIRKNKIPDITEICWLKDLPRLRNIWLEENPCSEGGAELYRLTVIKTLSQLQKLDNAQVTSEEMAEAMRRGLDLVHPLDGGSPPTFVEERRTSRAQDERVDERKISSRGQYYEQEYEQANRRESVQSPSRRVSVQGNPSAAVYEESRMSYSQSRNSLITEEVEEEGRPFRRSSSLHEMSPVLRSQDDDIRRMSIREEGSRYSEEVYRPQRSSYSGAAGSYGDRGPYLEQRGPYGDPRGPYQDFRSPQLSQADMHAVVNHHYNATYRQVDQQLESAQQLLSQRQSTSPLQKPYPIRPKNRNSNVLSAILCLIKEIDGPSLEVVEMAVRCRMEELED